MRWFLACCLLLLIAPISRAADPSKLYGTWRLVSYQSTIVATGEVENIFGSAPQGYIQYGPDGRMIVLIVAEKRPHPASLDKMSDAERADLFRAMIAYAGTYTFDGTTITHHLDVSWNQVWSGTDHLRNLQLDGDRLTLRTNAQPRSQDGKVAINSLVWERVK